MHCKDKNILLLQRNGENHNYANCHSIPRRPVCRHFTFKEYFVVKSALIVLLQSKCVSLTANGIR